MPTIDISEGELVDRHTIATIRALKCGLLAMPEDTEEDEVTDKQKAAAVQLRNVCGELAALITTCNSQSIRQANLILEYAAMLAVNRKLWDLEDEVRKELDDVQMVTAAKQIFTLNQDRNSIKRRISALFENIDSEPAKEYK